MDNLEYKGYHGSVEYSKADNCLVGKVLGMNKDSITYEGVTLDELKADFEAGVDSYLNGCAEPGIRWKIQRNTFLEMGYFRIFDK